MIQLPFHGFHGQGPVWHQYECECMSVKGVIVTHGEMCACLSVTYVHTHLCYPQRRGLLSPARGSDFTNTGSQRRVSVPRICLNTPLLADLKIPLWEPHLGGIQALIPMKD